MQRGFTLVEVLLALVLTSLLLLACLMAIDLAARVNLAASEPLEESARAAALFRTLSDDLRQIAVVPAQRRQSPLVGLIGGPDWIAVLRPWDRDASQQGAAGRGPQEPLRWVVYGTVTSGRWTRGESNGRSAERFPVPTDMTGLVRWEFADWQRAAGVAAAPPSGLLRADRVAQELPLKIRYRTGDGWLSAWDGDRRNLPTAVEVRLESPAALAATSDPETRSGWRRVFDLSSRWPSSETGQASPHKEPKR